MKPANPKPHGRPKAPAFLWVALFAQLTAGCGTIPGTWRVLGVDPPAARFPLSTVSLDDQGRFTSTTVSNGAGHTRTGTYKWNGRTLTLIASDGVIREFRGRKASASELTLRWEAESGTVEARLTKLE